MKYTLYVVAAVVALSPLALAKTTKPAAPPAAEPISVSHENSTMTILPDGTLTLHTKGPGRAAWAQSYAAGEFVIKVDRKAVPRLKDTVDKKKDGAYGDKEFRKLRKVARAHPVRAVGLNCRTKKGNTTCDVRALGNQPSSLPMPGAHPYAFFCFDPGNKKLSEMTVYDHQGHLKNVPLVIPPGKSYPFILPKGKSCTGNIVLRIPESRERDVFGGATIVASSTTKAHGKHPHKKR